MILTKRNNTYVRIDSYPAQDGVTEIGFTHTSERMERTWQNIWKKNVFELGHEVLKGSNL